MTVSIATIRDGLKTRLATISGLRAFDTIPDNLSPPCAVVGMPTAIDYDLSMARGADRFTFPVRVIVGRVTERQAQDRLDAYASGSGSSSIKAAIEADPTLSASAMSARVTGASGFGVYDLGGAVYLGFELSIDVIA